MDSSPLRWKRLRPWILLHLLPALGPIRSGQLLHQLEHPDALLDPAIINAVPGMPVATRTALGQWHRGRGEFWNYASEQLERIGQWGQQPDCHLLCVEDSAYPPLLAEIPDPPPLLYIEGNPELLKSPQVAVVGSRHCSHQGADIAFEFGYQLSHSGLTVTSGLARGIDTSAHRGALRGMAPTLAVLGTGIDRCYPAQNRELARELVETGGALVSEFGLGVAPRPGHFPRRNRIISGLSMGVLVVEAAEKSGTLVTAQLALEQGREVFAVPGTIRQGKSAGCHRLIREGAMLVESSAEIVRGLAPQFLQPLLHTGPGAERENSMEGDRLTLQRTDPLTPEEESLFAMLDTEPCCLDLLVVRCQRPVTEIMVMLQRMELGGWVLRVPGGYQRAGANPACN
ncbi:DNA-processing protein DprA [Aestuariirhabdus sp. LZHN29]|uniref:DNA-processing protein DprA n=1 Tax=Aestuariirhabdus sp. LZHN29 TaxID=3417462 RepID=UPI003CECC3D3